MPTTDDGVIALAAVEILVSIYRAEGRQLSLDSGYRSLHAAAVGFTRDDSEQHADIPRAPTHAEVVVAYELRRQLEAAYPDVARDDITAALHAAAALLLVDWPR